MNTIDEYIAAQSVEIQPLLEKIRETIRAAAPNCVERMAWGMPTFSHERLGKDIIHFAAAKKHIGVYPGYLHHLTPFTERIRDYAANKSTLQFQYGKSIDYELIADITRWRVLCVEDGGGAFGE